MSEGKSDKLKPQADRSSLGQRLLFAAWRYIPNGGRAGRLPFAVKVLLWWLGGLVVLMPLAAFGPVGISEFAEMSRFDLAASAAIGWTLSMFLFVGKLRT
jgi:hypothetical protein